MKDAAPKAFLAVVLITLLLTFSTAGVVMGATLTFDNSNDPAVRIPSYTEKGLTIATATAPELVLFCVGSSGSGTCSSPPDGLLRFGQDGSGTAFGPWTWDITFGGEAFRLVSVEVWEGGQSARFEAFDESGSLGTQDIEPAGVGVGFGVIRSFLGIFDRVTRVRVRIQPGSFDLTALTFEAAAPARVVGVRNMVRFDNVRTSLLRLLGAFTLQQNFFVYEPETSNPVYWVQNAVGFRRRLSGLNLWEVKPTFQVHIWDPQTLDFVLLKDCPSQVLWLCRLWYVDRRGWQAVSLPAEVILESRLDLGDGVVRFETFANGQQIGSFATTPGRVDVSSASAVITQPHFIQAAYEQPELAIVGVVTPLIPDFDPPTAGTVTSWIQFNDGGWEPAAQIPLRPGCSQTAEQSRDLYWTSDGTVFSATPSSSSHEALGVKFNAFDQLLACLN